MMITNLQQAEAFDWVYLKTPLGELIEKYFDVEYLSGSDGAFISINVKTSEGKEN